MWSGVLIRSIGLGPAQPGRRAKLFQLMRLVTYCERNYNLGPKGTGKKRGPAPFRESKSGGAGPTGAFVQRRLCFSLPRNGR